MLGALVLLGVWFLFGEQIRQTTVKVAENAKKAAEIAAVAGA